MGLLLTVECLGCMHFFGIMPGPKISIIYSPYCRLMSDYEVTLVNDNSKPSSP
jgi:hypothetical protein